MKDLSKATGNYICPICKKNKAQIYGDSVQGKFVEGCWDCLYK